MVALAEHWAQYSTCLKRQVGAVIFNPETKAIMSMGYNDTPIGQQDCGDGGCVRCKGVEAAREYLDCLCVHAEMNGLAFAARYGHETEGCWLATTFTVCPSCRKNLYQAGIVHIVEPEREYDL